MSGLTEQFYVDALIAYVITYNQEETGANKLGHGEAPWKTMGIRCYRPERLRTFGAFGWLKLPGKHKDEQGRLGGLKERWHLVVLLGYSWTMRSYAVLDIKRRMIYVSRRVNVDRSTTASEWGVTNYLRQLRENPALAKAQTSSTGKRWVKSVFKDLNAGFAPPALFSDRLQFCHRSVGEPETRFRPLRAAVGHLSLGYDRGAA